MCCDGLTGLPAAVNSVWPEAVVQTCVSEVVNRPLNHVKLVVDNRSCELVRTS